MRREHQLEEILDALGWGTVFGGFDTNVHNSFLVLRPRVIQHEVCMGSVSRHLHQTECPFDILSDKPTRV